MVAYMPSGIVNLNKASEIQKENLFSSRDIENISNDENIYLIQLFRMPFEEEVVLLNEVFMRYPKMKLQIWHDVKDLGFLQSLPSVTYLSIHNNGVLNNIETLITLTNLEVVRLNLSEQMDYSFIKELPQTLKKIELQFPNKKVNFDYQWLERFAQLELLSVQGRKKDIEQVGTLKQINALILQGITVPHYDFINHLSQLDTLSIRLGASHNFDALKMNTTIKNLEFWCVSRLSDLDFIKSMSTVESLYLQELRNVNYLPNLSGMVNLRTLGLNGMNGLVDISGIERASALKKFVCVSNKNIDIGIYLPVFENKAIVSVYMSQFTQKNLMKYKQLHSEHQKQEAPKPYMPKWIIDF